MMDREAARQYIKAQLESYLRGKGLSVERPFRCINPAHPDKHPSMRYDARRQKVHCFACGADYDMLDVIGIEYGLSADKDKFDKAYALFHIETNTHTHTHDNTHDNTHGDTDTHSESRKEEKPLPSKDVEAYLARVRAALDQTDYPALRGISTATAQAYGLGFDPAFRTQEEGKPAVWKALIIPTGEGSYTARNTDPAAGKASRIRKQGASPVYNAPALFQRREDGGAEPVFVVEGEIDALSVLEAGCQAVALGSTANTQHFLRLMARERPAAPLLLALDHDPAGEKAAGELAEGLTGLGVPFYLADIAGACKDPNEALTQDREAFTAALQAALLLPQAELLAQQKAYANTCVAAHLQEFVDGIADSVNTPAIPTGFGGLDAALEGGLFEGLYVLGAITSLGKTTFVLQIADQIAQQGQDVLMISLEMARSELMAKSISRLTLQACLEEGLTPALAKTTRGITVGKRYGGYTEQERSRIRQAVTDYAGYANALYFHEGVGDIGVTQAREMVRRHLDNTGRRPVLVIDYLQILAPHSERMTDKQNTDKAVLELKRISRDYKIPVIGISSFNRQNYKEAVTMEAFKESGAIEYSSDVLLGLQFQGAGEKTFDANLAKQKNPRDVELRVLKNRNGASGGLISLEYYPMFNFYREKEGARGH